MTIAAAIVAAWFTVACLLSSPVARILAAQGDRYPIVPENTNDPRAIPEKAAHGSSTEGA